jgi:hypothetical protein
LYLIGLTHLYPSNFGYGIPLVGGLEGAANQMLFLNGLGSEPRIDARRAQKKQLFYPRSPCRIDYVGSIPDFLKKPI